jgi:hypothetical protein
MSAEEKEQKIEQAVKTIDSAKVFSKVKFACEVIIAVGTVLTFVWVGRGWVDDLKQTVTDNASDTKHQMDSLYLDNRSDINTLIEKNEQLSGKQTELAKDFNTYLRRHFDVIR